jgi:hypothetical protein
LKKIFFCAYLNIIYIYIYTWISLVNSPYLVGFSRRTVAPQVVLRAVQKSGLALQFAAQELRGDKEMLPGAMWTNLAGEEWVIIEVYPLVIEHSY